MLGSIKPAKLLVVEDSEADVEIVRQSTKKTKLLIDLYVLECGEDALKYLDECKKEELPDLIFLDINMPGISGIEVLKRIRSNPKFESIPIVMMTSSDRQEEIALCYKLRANCYITKPLRLEEFNKVINEVENFWFTIVKLPK